MSEHAQAQPVVAVGRFTVQADAVPPVPTITSKAADPLLADTEGDVPHVPIVGAVELFQSLVFI